MEDPTQTNLHSDNVLDGLLLSNVDIGKLLSVIGSISFLFGWIYDMGYFFALDFTLLGTLGINDYVLSTLNSLPWVIGFIFLLVAGQYLAYPRYPSEVERPIAGDLRRKQRVRFIRQYVLYGSPTYMLVVLYLIAYHYSPSENATVVLVIAGVGSVISSMILITVRKRYTLSVDAFTLAFWIWSCICLLGLVGFAGAIEANIALRKDRLTDTIQTKDHQFALVRIFSNGMLGVDTERQKLIFVPNGEVLSVSSRAMK